MSASTRPLARVSLVFMAIGSAIAWQDALAVGTAASTPVNNRATVSYTVGGAAQTPIESSPAGNSVAGTGNGADTSFVVDNRIDLTVVEIGAAATVTTPGATNVVTTFSVSNTGNAPQGYALTAINLAGTTLFGQTDNTDVTNLRVFVDSNGNGLYDAGTDAATNIDTLAADATIAVFVLADVPNTVTNAQYANVQLTAQAAVAGTAGATLATETVGADTAGTVDVVFGDSGRDATEAAADQYAVQSAALSVAKSSVVISDPFNLGTNPKAIPGAVIEYAVTLINTGAVAAAGVQIVDPLQADTTFSTGLYAGSTDVSITVGANPATFCTAEAGVDSNADGCFRTGATLTVGAPALGTVGTGAANAVVVRFRAAIN